MNPQKKKGLPLGKPFSINKMAWLRGLDLNQRPPGYEPDELPGCSTPRKHDSGCVRCGQISRTNKFCAFGVPTRKKSALDLETASIAHHEL
jgi:hypothetical protein